MQNAKAIEKAVLELPSEELVKFRRWFAQFDEATWDAQVEADAAAGKLDVLAAEARTEYNHGKVREL